MPWCCCGWGWCPRQGPARNSSLLSTKGGAQLGCFFQALPLTFVLMGCYLAKAWAYFKASEICSMFSYEMMYFHLFRKQIFWVPICETVCWAGQRLDAVIPGECGTRRQDSLLRPSSAQRKPAHCPPPVVSQVGAVDPGWGSGLFFSFNHVLDSSPKTS